MNLVGTPKFDLGRNSCIGKLNSTVCSTCRSGRKQALQHVQVLLNQVNDMRSYSHELSKYMKVKFSEIRTLLVKLSSQWLLCQRQFQQGKTY